MEYENYDDELEYLLALLRVHNRANSTTTKNKMLESNEAI